jgi:hypothetical protein
MEIFTALFMLFIGMYLSSEFQFGSRIAFQLGASGEKRLQVVDKRTVRKLHGFLCAFHLSFDIAFLNRRVDLSHMLQLLACHSYSILSCCAAAVFWAGTRRFSNRSCMRLQSSNVSEASAVQMSSCSQCSEQKTFGYCDVDLCGP